DIERLHVHLESVLREIQFLRPHQGETLQRLRHLIARAEPDVLELNILRGILNRIEQTLNPKA
ncbi:MAG: tRNA (cytidine32/uridine32-2'-O)-methyltransferase, partial [Arenicella sp.]